jgi:gliding motility-associated-like protein
MKCLQIILFLLFFTLFEKAFATHIIGGSMTYRSFEHTANDNTYQLSLRLYRDCLRGEPTMPKEITIAVYRGDRTTSLVRINGNSVTKIRLRDTGYIVPPSYKCLITPDDVCVQYGNYEWELKLPIIAESYFIVFQTCCRNEVIQNVVKPLETGATYYVEITPKAQQAVNSSPQFVDVPPTVICLNENIEINHKATDSDGDSLVYAFCVPFNEGSLAVSGCGVVPCAPPYVPLNFKPSFSTEIPLGENGAPPLTIDSKTGKIKGVAPFAGFFVVNLCVKEYRNGVLIGQIFREFEFKTIACPKQVEAVVEADSIIQLPNGQRLYILNICEKKLKIQNLSRTIANIKSQDWSFLVKNQAITSFDWQPPLLNFPTNGVYLGTLKLNKGKDCSDSIDIEMRVQNQISPPISNKDAFFCNGDSVKIGNRFYKTEQVVSDTLRSKRGCDSLIQVTQLKAQKPSFFKQNIRICNGQCSVIGKNRHCTEGVFSDTLKTIGGCDSIVLSTITVDKNVDCDTSQCRIFAPNVFSPNGDNVNDVFQLYSPQATILEMQIYDRWGGLLFKSDAQPPIWDGKTNEGKEIFIGVYVYLVKAKCVEGSAFWKAGDVTLVR